MAYGLESRAAVKVSVFISTKLKDIAIMFGVPALVLGDIYLGANFFQDTLFKHSWHPVIVLGGWLFSISLTTIQLMFWSDHNNWNGAKRDWRKLAQMLAIAAAFVLNTLINTVQATMMTTGQDTLFPHGPERTLPNMLTVYSVMLLSAVNDLFIGLMINAHRIAEEKAAAERVESERSEQHLAHAQ